MRTNAFAILIEILNLIKQTVDRKTHVSLLFVYIRNVTLNLPSIVHYTYRPLYGITIRRINNN